MTQRQGTPQHCRMPAIVRVSVCTLLSLLLSASWTAYAQWPDETDPYTDWELRPEAIANDPTSSEEKLNVPGKKVNIALDLPHGDGPWIIDDVQFTCDLKICDNPQVQQQLINAAGYAIDDEVDRDALIRALNRLARTERFEHISGAVTLTRAGHVAVLYEAKAALLIQRIRIRSGPFPQETIKRRISLRSGAFWTEDKAETQKKILKNYFERQGLYGAELEIATEEVGDHAVDVIIKIGQSKRLSINRIYIRGNETLSYEEISSIVLSEFNFLSSFTQQHVQKAVESVLAAYRSKGYIQARFERSDVKIDTETRSVDLYLEIKEGPHWSIEFIGNRTFSDQKLKETLTFYQTGFVDDVEIQNAARELRALYETRGYFFARVEPVQRNEEDGQRSIFFEIDEGPISEIRDIRFVGNTVFTTAELRENMRTSEYDLITPSGYLQRARLDDELQQIIKAYHNEGYLGAEVARVVMIGQQGGEELYLTIFIEEGPQTTVHAVDILQHQPDEDETRIIEGSLKQRILKKKDGLQNNKGWSVDRQKKTTARILQRLSDEGYGQAQIEASCRVQKIPVENCSYEPPASDCTKSLADDVEEICRRATSGTTIVEECDLSPTSAECRTPSVFVGGDVHMRYDVYPGEKTQLRDVFTVGNFATRDSVILQELPLQRSCINGRRKGKLHSGWSPDGDCPYISDMSLTMQANLRSIGIFDSVRVDTIGPDEDLNTATLVVKIEEGQTRYLDYRVGIDLGFTDSRNSLLSLPNEIVYRDLNFLGRGQELRLEGRFEPSMTNPKQTVDGLFDAELKAIYFDPRSYIFGRWRRPWETRLELSATWSELAPAPVPQTRILSAEFRIRNRIRRYRGIFYELGVSMRQTAARDTAQGIIDSPFSRVRILSITPNLTIELRDNPLNPTRGYFGEVSLELAEDFFALLGTESFTRLTTRHSGYIPLGRNVVLGLNARFGIGFGSLYNGFRTNRRFALPLGERFLLGGVNSVRGFSRDSIRANGTNEVGGDVMFTLNGELRYPLIPSINLYGTAFVDAGEVAVDIQDLTWDGIRVSTGLGVRWLLADLLPLVFDYGTVLNRKPGEGFGLLHFSIGYTF